MKRNFKIGTLGSFLSQSKTFVTSINWRPGHAVPHFFVFAVLIIGLAIGGGVISAYRVVFTAEAETKPAPAVANKEEELCRWKQDVAFFSRLGEETPPVLQAQAPCEEKRDVAVVKKESGANGELDQAIRELSAGYPLEAMAPAIARYDKEVAGLIVGIAKKESDWGKHVPLDTDGQDCFNYWGYKGAGTRGTAMGHGCFGSPEEAVKAVGDRLMELVKIKQTSEPKNLTVWKCGSSCATHSRASVLKWVSDVDLYYQQIAKK